MNITPPTAPFWTTSSFGGHTHTTPVEIGALGEHLQACNGGRGRLSRLVGAAQQVHGFVAGRFVTSLLLLLLLIGAVFLVA